jgi:inner membrane protein
LCEVFVNPRFTLRMQAAANMGAMLKDFIARSMLAKVLLLALLTLLLALPLAHIASLIHERGASRDQAKAELAQSHAGPQVLAGPVLVVPYVERWTEEVRGEGGTVSRVARTRSATHLVFPEKSHLAGELQAQQRYRGIFTVLFYGLRGTVAGQFAAFDPALLPRSEKNAAVEMQPPILALGLADVRGLQGTPQLTLAGAPARLLPRVPGVAEHSVLAQGVHAPLPAAALQAWQQRQPLAFELKLELVGQERLAIVPLADDTTAQLRSDWPHPSFGGEFLAVQREVRDNGFEARWSVSSLVSSARSQLLAPPSSPRAPGRSGFDGLDSFDVSLVEPLNVYALSLRAVKYGLLFIALTLLAAFMFELFARLRLHPVQYGLVGLSIALFFLLLLALSEKLPFGVAYLLAAAASVGLLAVYFSAVLKGVRRGVGLGAYVAALYAVLYGLLSSEDNALLLGSLLIFGLVALLMLATRRVDWYALSARPEAPLP